MRERIPGGGPTGRLRRWACRGGALGGALLMLLALTLPGCAPAPAADAGLPVDQPPSQSQAMSEPEPEPEPEPVVSHLMVAGDAMSHMPLTRDAYVKATGEYDYSHMLTDPAEQLAGADYAVANLETVLAGGPDYSGFPTFNSPDALAYNLKEAGFDLLSTANNHSRDKGVDGIFRTLDVLDEAGLAHVGTYRSREERDADSGLWVADVGGVSAAFLSYTYGLNGYQLSSEYSYAVNLFNLDYYTTLENPDYELLASDLAHARSLDTDLIAVIIHWGVEYQNAPNAHQTDLARFLVEQGADLVLGSHPHVLQPYETITVTGADGEEREGFVCYSLGNFISNQYEPAPAAQTTAILDLELTRDPVTGETALTDVSYVPYYMVHRDDQPVGQRRYLANIHRAMAEYETGSGTRVDRKTYQELQSALDHCHTVLGAEGDRG